MEPIRVLHQGGGPLPYPIPDAHPSAASEDAFAAAADPDLWAAAHGVYWGLSHRGCFLAITSKLFPPPGGAAKRNHGHANGHTNAAFHLNPDTRPHIARLRLDTVSLRGMHNQQIHGSTRSLRSVEDFTAFEQRTAYFDGDHVKAAKKA